MHSYRLLAAVVAVCVFQANGVYCQASHSLLNSTFQLAVSAPTNKTLDGQLVRASIDRTTEESSGNSGRLWVGGDSPATFSIQELSRRTVQEWHSVPPTLPKVPTLVVLFNGVAQAVSSYESYLEVKALDSNGEVDPWALSISESAASNTAQVDQVSTEGLTSGNNFAACAAYGQLEIYNYFDNHDTTTIFGTQCGPIKLAVVNVQQLQH